MIINLISQNSLITKQIKTMVNEVNPYPCICYLFAAVIMIPYLYELQGTNPDLFYFIMLIS